MLLTNILLSFVNIFKTEALECISVVNQKCIARPKITQTNANEPVFYALSIKVNKCGGDCNDHNCNDCNCNAIPLMIQ